MCSLYSHYYMSRKNLMYQIKLKFAIELFTEIVIYYGRKQIVFSLVNPAVYNVKYFQDNKTGHI